MSNYTKTIDDANIYFYPNNHIRAYNWRKYKNDEQIAALAQAKRIIILSSGREMQDPVSTDIYRDDYAIFEQALWILENTPRQKSSGVAGTITLVKDAEEGNMMDRKPILVCPEAQQYLSNNRIKFARG